MSVLEKPTSERLLEGAKQIGNYYRAGGRCKTMGWNIKLAEDAESCEVLLTLEDLCQCGSKETIFCKAKVKWLLLALVEPREIVPGEFGLALTMTGKEWDATGLTLTWMSSEIGEVKVGPKSGITMKSLRELGANPESGLTTLKLMKAFPGSKMEFEKSEGKEPVVEEKEAG